MIIVGEDLNGHVGEEIQGYDGVHGGFGYGSRNDEGGRVLDFAVAMDFVICNTWFKKEVSKLITYSSGGVNTTIDYLLTRKGDRNMVKDVKVIPGESCVSQHRLLVGGFEVERKSFKKVRYKSKLRVWKLKNKDIQNSFQEELRKSEEVWAAAPDVEEKWKVMREVLLDATEKTCGWTKGARRHQETWWWNDEVDLAIKRKRESFKIWYKSRSEEDYGKYKEDRKLANKIVATSKDKARRAWVNNLEKGENKNKNNVFKIVKQMVKEGKDVRGMSCLKNDKGDVVSNEQLVKDMWRRYMEKLMNVENIYNKDSLKSETINVGQFEEIDSEEVRKAMKKMKDGKAAGPSGIVNEMLQASGEIGITWIKDLVNLIITKEGIPLDWCSSVVIPIFKGKGDPMDCGSYRAVKLLEHTMKLMERILESRIREQVNIDEMQFGFMPGKGTVDAIFIARQIQEKYNAKRKDLYFAFIDLEKAFDRVPRDVLQWALRKAGVEEWLIKTVMGMYSKCSTSVKVGDGLSEPFEVKVGVHQGSVLSPLLFVIVMDVIAKEVGSGLPLELLYADDLLIMGESEEELRGKIMNWKTGLEGKGLKVNLSKTKVMTCGANAGETVKSGKWPCSVCNKGVGRNSITCTKCEKWVHGKCSGVKGKLASVESTFVCKICKEGRKVTAQGGNFVLGGGVGLERVNSYCYLGDVLSSRGGIEESLAIRSRSAWNKFRELGPILADKRVSLHLKGKLYASCVRPCMIYASETWAMRKEDVNRMVSVERQMVRRMCNVTLNDKQRSNSLLGKLGIDPIEEVVRRGRSRWFGHVERKNDWEWTKRCMSYEVVGKRPKGRPMKTWWNNVEEDMTHFGLERIDAQIRQRWRSRIGGRD